MDFVPFFAYRKKKKQQQKVLSAFSCNCLHEYQAQFVYTYKWKLFTIFPWHEFEAEAVNSPKRKKWHEQKCKHPSECTAKVKRKFVGFSFFFFSIYQTHCGDCKRCKAHNRWFMLMFQISRIELRIEIQKRKTNAAAAAKVAAKKKNASNLFSIN